MLHRPSLSVAVLLAALALGCKPKAADAQLVADPPTAGDADTDTDADSDADTDADSDADTDTDSDTDTDTGTPFTYVAGDPLGDAPALSASAVDAIADDIDAIVGGTSYSSGVVVIDVDSGQVVYEHLPDTAYKPASNTKLFTTAVAFDQLGEEHRFRSRAYGSLAGTNVPTLTVLVEHDFTWSSWFYVDRWFPADRLAEQLYDEGVRSVDELVLRGEVAVEAYQFGTLDVPAHRTDGRDVMVDALELVGIDVGSSSTSASLSPPGGPLLVERSSPPLHVADHPLNVYSHNEFADLHARHNGDELWADSSYAGGEAAVVDWLDGLGIDSSQVQLYDGSGLSHSNRVTARVVAEMTAAMVELPSGLAWERTLSTAGVEGTLGNRMLGADTAGRFVGKTGTLYDTIATSGVLHHAYDGHRYAIAVLFNNVGYQPTARSYCDQIVEAVAEDRRGVGLRPDPPVVDRVLNLGNGYLEAHWGSVAGADGYAVWVSTDGAWRRADALYIDDTSLVLGGLPLDVPVALRVQTVDGASVSNVSDTYIATPSMDASRVLLVDGNDRWDLGMWENTLEEGHDSLATVGRAATGFVFDSAANEAVIDGRVALDDYDAVIWTLGEESTDDLTFDADERDLVDDYLDGGGNLLVSGAEIGWDLDNLGDADMQGFYVDALKASYGGDDAGTYTAVPRPGGLFDEITEVGFFTPGTMDIAFPDLLVPQGGAVAELDYWGGTPGAAALSFSGSYRLVHLGFPLESVDALEDREVLVARSLEFFGL